MHETCAIQWVDEQGNATPDSNPAVGRAYMAARVVQFSHGGVRMDESTHYPICAEHRARMIAEGLESEHWHFEPIG